MELPLSFLARRHTHLDGFHRPGRGTDDARQSRRHEGAFSLLKIARSFPLAFLLLLSAGITATPVHAASSVGKLTWTAPGDDGAVGVAARYDIRRSTVPITMLNFMISDTVAGAPAPARAGTIQSCPVVLPQAGVTYY